jgi:methylenetetrahydrofolate reductase (NADPH)
VTASPNKGIDATVDWAARLQADGFRAIPHLSARMIASRSVLSGLLERAREAGVTHAFVVGGDADEPGEYLDGLSLLRAMAELGRRPARVGVPSYPEGHWAIDDDTLWTSLRAKQSHADYTVTQLCFDADTVCRFVAAARDRGVGLPVVVGVPGVVDAGRLLRISLRIGVGDAVRFARAHRSTAAALVRPGRYEPDDLVRALAAHVADGRCVLAGLHLYTFNQIAPTVRWLTDAGRPSPGSAGHPPAATGGR